MIFLSHPHPSEAPVFVGPRGRIGGSDIINNSPGLGNTAEPGKGRDYPAKTQTLVRIFSHCTSLPLDGPDVISKQIARHAYNVERVPVPVIAWIDPEVGHQGLASIVM